jgi:hypothetical protein
VDVEGVASVRRSGVCVETIHDLDVDKDYLTRFRTSITPLRFRTSITDK